MLTCGLYSGMSSEVVSWENISGTGHTIYSYKFSGTFYTSDFQQQSPFLPMIGIFEIPTGDFFDFGFLTFVKSEGQNDEIFVNEDWEISPLLSSYYNLSESPFEETNPAFFNGGCPLDNCILINIWESKRNDHWQLYYSINDLPCFGGISDQDQSHKINLEISPNPVRNECDINYTINEDGPVSLELCTLDGKQIQLFDWEFLKKGTYTYHLDFDHILLVKNYSGLFLIRLQAGKNSVVQKMIKIN